MRILLIGGTRFIGRHVVESALSSGHEVTIFHRGRTGADLFPDAEHRLGDRDSDLSALADGSWDATGLLLESYDEVRAVAARLPYVTSSW